MDCALQRWPGSRLPFHLGENSAKQLSVLSRADQRRFERACVQAGDVQVEVPLIRWRWIALSFIGGCAVFRIIAALGRSKRPAYGNAINREAGIGPGYFVERKIRGGRRNLNRLRQPVQFGLRMSDPERALGFSRSGQTR